MVPWNTFTSRQMSCQKGRTNRVPEGEKKSQKCCSIQAPKQAESVRRKTCKAKRRVEQTTRLALFGFIWITLPALQHWSCYVMSTQSLSDAYEKVRGPNPQARLKSETSQIPRANLLPNIYNRTLSNRRSSAASVLPFKFFPLLAALPIISHSSAPQSSPFVYLSHPAVSGHL